MHGIQDEYLQFIHRFRFTGASNHVQAQALTELLRKRLRLPEIFADLNEEIRSATDYLFNRATSRGARTVERLQVFGVVGLTLALTFAFFSADLRVYSQWLGAALKEALRPATVGPHFLRPIATLTLAMAVFTSLSWLGLWNLHMAEQRRVGYSVDKTAVATRRPPTSDERIIRGVRWLAVFSWILGLVLTVGWGLTTGGSFE